MDQQDIRDVENLSKVFTLEETLRNVKTARIDIPEKDVRAIWDKYNKKKVPVKKKTGAKTQKDALYLLTELVSKLKQYDNMKEIVSEYTVKLKEVI